MSMRNHVLYWAMTLIGFNAVWLMLLTDVRWVQWLALMLSWVFGASISAWLIRNKQ